MKPWVRGPAELLAHAVGHIENGSAFDYRIALISIDNAVELTIKTYLGLPRRVRRSAGPPRKRLEESAGSFPGLLDLLEEFGEDQLEGIELGDLEWYHRLRNTLYHEGNGITVDPEHADAYLQVARLLIRNLLGQDAPGEQPGEAPSTVVGELVLKWSLVEHNLRVLLEQIVVEPSPRFRDMVLDLAGSGLVTTAVEREFLDLRQIRNEVVHSINPPSNGELEMVMARMTALNQLLLDLYAEQLRDERGQERSGGGAI